MCEIIVEVMQQALNQCHDINQITIDRVSSYNQSGLKTCG